MLGLQTALGVAIGHSGCAPRRVIELMSWAPAAIAGLSEAHGGDIAEGRAANLVVFDPVEKWQQSVESIVSKSVNTPYLDVSLTGKVRHVLYQGRIVVNQGGLV